MKAKVALVMGPERVTLRLAKEGFAVSVVAVTRPGAQLSVSGTGQ